MPPGSTLIQPAGTVHAPFSLTEVYMQGSMHWDSRNMLSSIQSVAHDLKYTNSTNEPFLPDCLVKLNLVSTLWEEALTPPIPGHDGGPSRWEWGSAAAIKGS